jgi:probable O-glycosylation ligase (exosortase A-associated)
MGFARLVSFFVSFAILGTQSRGAFVGVIAMGLYMAMKSRQKVGYILLVLFLAPVGFLFMPEAWHERMASIADYQSDGSAMGRIMAWHMALNLASDRLTGGGFEVFRPTTYLIYLPEVGGRKTDAHSIYFEVIGEHGFIGLAIFLLLGILALRMCKRIMKQCTPYPDMVWMVNLAAMMQVSLVGYAVAGAFLGLAYFNYYYALIAIVVGMSTVTKKRFAEEASAPQRAEAATRGGPVSVFGRPSAVPVPSVRSSLRDRLMQAVQDAKLFYSRL